MTDIVALDQGTTSSRAIRFGADLRVQAVAQQEFPQIYPAPGWVEHDPQAIWQTTLACARKVVTDRTAAIGITNQRETVVIWDRATGRPIHNAIVWQDRRTADTCAALAASGHGPEVSFKTGLLLDPYFSATKIGWILDSVPGAQAQAEAGALAFGTIDVFLIWRLTGGRVHATDATNAARTMLYDIGRGQWDADLCRLFGVPEALLPEVRDCADDFGTTDPAHFGRAIPIAGVAGDQQRVASGHRLLSTIAWRLDGQVSYALEGSIFIAGAVVQWLRDGLGVIETASQTQALAEAADPAQGVVIVPAFTGLGAPYWRPETRGAVLGLTRNSGRAEMARAALESVGYQTRDLWAAMRADWAAAGGGEGPDTVLRVDGGMASSDWTMQFLADILGAPVDRPVVTETTALGAAWLAGYRLGICPGPADFAATWALERRFDPAMPEAERSAKYTRWQRAVAATMAF
jgi:glycerol kinase